MPRRPANGAAAPDPDELLTADEAAGILGVSPQVVRHHARRGTLAGRQIGRQWVFTRAVVAAFVAPPPGPKRRDS